jgi:acyl-CoA thioesterase FadM
MIHATPFTVGLADTDALGVAYHPYALQLAQRNLESWLARLGLPLADIVNNHTWALPVVRVELDWHRPLHLGTEGETQLSDIETGSKSLTLTHSIDSLDMAWMNRAGDPIAATVKVVHACVDRRSPHESRPLPTILTDLLPS